MAVPAARGVEPEADPLPRVPPRSPAEALGTFSIRPGMAVELVAHEPGVVDPVDVAFDARGRLYVVEMRGYSERRDEALGRVKLLEDRDGDGFYESGSAAVFADGLRWPTSVVCYDGGVLVAASPELIYLKDEDNDGVADRREVWFTGFGESSGGGADRLNVQALVNGLEWGLDNRIYGATAGNGGLVRNPDDPDAAPVDLRGQDFSIDPRRRELRPESGTAQYGLSFDSVGRRFVCSNSRHAIAVVYESDHGHTAPSGWSGGGAALPHPLADIPADGPAAEVFRTSPDEPWRVVRTRWRVAGLVGGPVEGGGRPSGYFTGASGITVYTGDAFGPGFRDNLFTGDVGSNLVHRKRVRRIPGSVQPVAERPGDELDREFLASSDNWFRPVNFHCGPDGCLTVVDMYREVIEHPWSLPPGLKEQLDLNSGNGRGRLYRVRPEGDPPRVAPEVDLAESADLELVGLLGHANGWHRRTAQRLLWERGDPSAETVAALVEAATGGGGDGPDNDPPHAPAARLHALWALHGLGVLGPAHLEAALASPHPEVRATAVRLARPAAAAALAADPDAAVRFAVARRLAAGGPAVGGRTRAAAIESLALRCGGDRWLEAAVLGALGSSSEAAALFRALAGSPSPGALALAPLARAIGRSGDREAVDVVAGFLLATPTPEGSEPSTDAGTDAVLVAVAVALGRGLQEGGGSGRSPVTLTDLLAPDRGALPGLVNRALEVAGDGSSAVGPPGRAAALELGGLVRHPRVTARLRALLGEALAAGGTGDPDVVFEALVSALAAHRWPGLAEAVLARWPSLDPARRLAAIGPILNDPDSALAVLAAVTEGRLAATEVSPAQQRALRQHRDLAVRARAAEVLPAPVADRTALVASYLGALDLAADAGRGRELFASACAVCHEPPAPGATPAGPHRDSFRGAGKAGLLTAILDPNREVPPAYATYALTTRGGATGVGTVGNHGDTVTLRQADGSEFVVPASDVESLQALGQSLMPEGFESALDLQAMADLLAYLAGDG